MTLTQTAIARAEFRGEILITGGNSGIGRALAEALIRAGNRVVITGRNAQSLAQTLADNPAMTGYALDVLAPDAMAEFLPKILKNHPSLATVILNAGIMEAEDYRADPVDLAPALRMIETNLTAPIRLAAGLLPHLMRQERAHVITVSSGLAFVPKATNPVYSATKAAIHSWTQALRHQLRESAVRVHELAPPLVATELTAGQSANPAALPLAAFIEEVMAILSGPLPDEILVQRVGFQRRAEAEGRYDATFRAING